MFKYFSLFQIGVLSNNHKFFDHGDYVATDYNMFDTFEGYTWHKYEHSAHSQ